MAGARAFMEGWKRLLEELGSGEVTYDVLPADDGGQLFGRIALGGGLGLEVSLRLEFKVSPRLRRYSLQLMDQHGGCTLRFDNSPYHHNLPGAPHHMHVGDRVLPVMPEPSLRTMLAAVRDELER